MFLRPSMLAGLLAAFLIPSVTEALEAQAGSSPPASAAEDGAGHRDPHTLGNPHQIRVRRLELDLTVDFERKQLRGTAQLIFERMPGCPAGAPLVLDSRNLAIERVEAATMAGRLAAARFALGPEDPILGTRITIEVPDDATRVRITYHTGAQAAALQWLTPAQTAGGKTPFLYTKSSSARCRSWIPLQDSPGVRMTFAATIRVPEGLTAVMGTDSVPLPRGGAASVFRFEMPQSVPSYLIALAVGDLSFRPLGARTGVYAEPSVVDRAAFEFADTERMIAAAEKRFGPYRWGRYDILVLPPSFPLGGMENPKLTFLTPTLLAGDRSLVGLVAHELAHSWAGNLVTNATWADYWLNEGFGVYLQRRIIEDVYGPERAAMAAVLGMQELRADMNHLVPKEQVLYPDLTGRNPDDTPTEIPYEKGFLFLTALEHAFGRERLDAYLLSYFDRFAFRSVSTADVERDLRANLFAADPAAGVRVNMHAWLYEPGLPADFLQPRSDRFNAVDDQVHRWLDGAISADRIVAAGWSTQEWLRFLQALPEDLPAARLAELDAVHQLTDRGNAEVVAQWLLMAVRGNYAPAEQRLETFLTTIGRRKYVMPLYTELAKTPFGKARARAIYAEARPLYHPIVVGSIDQLLGLP
jgi:leukotriene-A4 hydrolase